MRGPGPGVITDPPTQGGGLGPEFGVWGLGFWGFGVLGFWGFGVLGFWGFGVLGFWGFGVLGFWGFGVLGFWGLEGSRHRMVEGPKKPGASQATSAPNFFGFPQP